MRASLRGNPGIHAIHDLKNSIMDFLNEYILCILTVDNSYFN